MSDSLDRVIDDVARRMTQGAAPSDLRARVFAQIDRPPRRNRTLWTLAPIAAAALIIVAVFVARSSSLAPLKGRPTYGQRPIPEARAPRSAAAADGPSTTITSDATHRDAARADVGHGFSGAVRFSGTATRRPAVAAAPTSDVDALTPAAIEMGSIDIDAMTTASIEVPPLETIDLIPVAPLAAPEGGRP